MMKKFSFQTRNKEAYEKFNMLNYSNDVILNKDSLVSIERILRNINRNANNVEIVHAGDFIVLKKINPIKLNAYLMK